MRRNLIHILNAEKLASWYFRLNGFMTIESFILHDRSSKGLAQRTDADILGVRFPFRQELDMQDDLRFRNQPEKPLFIIGEIKSGECKLNGPWTDPLKQNLQYVLGAIGGFEPRIIDKVATALHTKYVYEDELRKVQLLAIGSRLNVEYQRDRKGLDQLLFIEMLAFVYRRFHDFRMQKRDHKQWDNVGNYLYAEAEHDEAVFVSTVLRAAGLHLAQ